jgi:hypothetical protein
VIVDQRQPKIADRVVDVILPDIVGRDERFANDIT